MGPRKGEKGFNKRVQGKSSKGSTCNRAKIQQPEGGIIGVFKGLPVEDLTLQRAGGKNIQLTVVQVIIKSAQDRLRGWDRLMRPWEENGTRKESCRSPGIIEKDSKL